MIVGDVSTGVGDAVLGVGDEDLRLLGLIRWRQVQVRLPSPVADGGGLEDVAEVVHLQRQRVADPRIGRLALVVVADRLPGMGEEHGVAVAAPRLQLPDREVLLGDGVGVLLLRPCRPGRRPPGAAWSP